MSLGPDSSTIGVLTSGGLDSCILVGKLLREGHRVQPFYIRTELRWQTPELQSLQRFLSAIAAENLSPLVQLELPLGDLYGTHWSTTGSNVPGAESPDEAVFLPGRNALLMVKAAVWCQLHGVPQLALAPLGTSPFEDAQEPFIQDFQAAINRGVAHEVRIVRPFAGIGKRNVMQFGAGLPLELTFSCIAPQGSLHCGQCNKCAERQAAFQAAELPDKTIYARSMPHISHAQLLR